MINKDEMLFAVDENNQPIEPVARQVVHKEGIWHRTADVIVMNSNFEVLCHKRSMLKDMSPGLWDVCFGGHILAGADFLASALQELEEESGLKAHPPDLKLVTTVKFADPTSKNREFRYCYLYRWDGPMSDLKLEKDEIDEVRWTSLQTIINNRNNPKEWSWMPYLDALLEMIKYYERS